MTNPFTKPSPNDSIYKHVAMLFNYCKYGADNAVNDEVKTAFLQTAGSLERLLDSSAVKTLSDFGE